MSQAIEQLQSEWNEIKAQLDEIQAEYRALCDKRSCFYGMLIFPKDNSPEAQAEFDQQCQTQVTQWSVNLPDLEREIKAIHLKMKKIQAKLAVKQAKIYELQAKEIWLELGQKARTINQLSQQIKQEVQNFWQFSHSFQPRYQDWLPEPPQLVYRDQIPTVPVIQETENGLELTHQEINLEKD
ncbi:hypothetical protein ACL6C3_29380 [Capilliphycus salinus ALCB114379]|uniref:hypothetical protein n=1 Tax=Capilliphycus salinus TaxID=2768948 RepID=UPI0039A44FB2